MANDLLDARKKIVILEQLRLIGESEFFRGSQRCRQFLEYSVNYVLEGRPSGELKERIIGIEVFRKAGDYDTAQDNIVRVTANEVRKRLAQYYGDGGQNADPVFQLPSGTYAVLFRWAVDKAPNVPSTPGDAAPAATDSEPVVSAPARSLPFRWKVLALVATVLVALVCVGILLQQRQADLVRRVWAPFLDNPKAAVICLGEPMAYRPASNHDVPLGPADQMVPLPDQLIGTGDAYALADISKYLSHHRTDWTLLARSSTSSETLFNNPTILVGAYSNPWTLALMDNLRFYFGPDNTIYDRAKPGLVWKVGMSATWTTEQDYAIVSRFVSPSTGLPVLIIAGIYSYGTRAAATFALDPGMLADALRDAPPDWDQKNFEFVIHTRIIGKTPARPRIVAAHFW